MRGLTAAVGAAVVVVIAAALYLRSGGVDHQEPAPVSNAAGRRAQPAAPRAMERSARVEERLSELRGETDRHPAAANPAPNKREVPAAAEPKRTYEDLEAISDGDPADDPEDIIELKQTLLRNPDPDERIGAVLMLTGEEGPESLRVLLQAMDDPNAEVRLAVVEALGDRSEDLNPAVLDSALKDSDPEVRFEAVSILGDMETPDAMERIHAALNDPDEDVRNLAEGILDFADDLEPEPHGQARN